MPELIKEESHEIEVPAQKKGEVQFLTKAAIANPTPKGLMTVLKIIKKFTVYAGGVMAGTTIFSGNDTKVIIFIGVMVYGLCDAIETGTGVVSDKDQR